MMNNGIAGFAGVLMLAVVASATAGECPSLMADIDALLEEQTDLDDGAAKEARRLRVEGEKLHREGKHGESVDVLSQALELLTSD